MRTTADIDRLPIPDPEGELRYVMDAVRTIRRELNGRVPLIGFAGSPWTVGTYMVEGGGSKNFEHIKGMLYGAPQELHRLLDVITRATIAYLNGQIAAGAQAVMVFDTWGGALTPGRLPRVLAALHAADRRRRDARSRRAPRAGHPLHQGRRRLAGPTWRPPAATRSASTG